MFTLRDCMKFTTQNGFKVAMGKPHTKIKEVDKIAVGIHTWQKSKKKKKIGTPGWDLNSQSHACEAELLDKSVVALNCILLWLDVLQSITRNRKRK